jgi:hypothetical protein
MLSALIKYNWYYFQLSAPASRRRLAQKLVLSKAQKTYPQGSKTPKTASVTLWALRLKNESVKTRVICEDIKRGHPQV